MESPQHIKSRLKSVKNIGQITKAMEVVSATKMRRAQEVALASRPYAYRALELLETLGKLKAQMTNVKIEIPLAEKREVKKTLLVVVTSDKGLAGAFNTQVFRQVEQFLAQEGSFSEIHVVPVGKRAVSYFTRRNAKIVESFTGFGDYAMPEEIEPLGNLLVEGFLKGDWDRVVTISTHFRTTLKQTPLARQILPVEVEKIGETVKEIIPEHGRFAELSGSTAKSAEAVGPLGTEYILEPDPQTTLNQLVPHLVTMQLYHVVLEANASEHSARMVAMKTASDNASDLADGLTLEFNKARQAGITKEIIEITSTMNALT